MKESHKSKITKEDILTFLESQDPNEIIDLENSYTGVTARIAKQLFGECDDLLEIHARFDVVSIYTNNDYNDPITEYHICESYINFQEYIDLAGYLLNYKVKDIITMYKQFIDESIVDELPSQHDNV